ncbi:MAG: poly [ADP-ribose] polymerase tankyrase-like [Candidatus Midichloriaceae bacterium]|jgi:ankyrin repeat protein|nr:poly [ADP-ribose] polymerase tankyrase-like [Candidatus Midichloriaceae bacterium]
MLGEEKDIFQLIENADVDGLENFLEFNPETINIKNSKDSKIINIKDFFPLHLAIMVGNLKIVKLLLDKGADVNAKIDGILDTPLHIATAYSHLEIVELLLERGADVNAKFAVNETTPLHASAIRGNLEIFKFLYKNGADVNAKDNKDQTPIDYIIKYVNTEEAKHKQQLLIMGITALASVCLVALYYNGYVANLIKNLSDFCKENIPSFTSFSIAAGPGL